MEQRPIDDEDLAATTSGANNLVATNETLDCPICLQTCIHPARLPCGHIFCFLCVKGVAYKNRRCAMCRREIPPEFLDHPQLVNGIEDICTTKATDDGYQWFYEGRNGWWQYDDRTSQDIEEAFNKSEKSCTILVAGYVYIVDLESMLQQRQNEPSRCRRVKRDLATTPKKGIAGLRIEGNTVMTDSNFATRVLNDLQNNGFTLNLDELDLDDRIDISMRNPNSASEFIASINAADAAIRIASDIIGSTLADADELTRNVAATNDDAIGENSRSNVAPLAGSELTAGNLELQNAAEALDATQSNVVAGVEQHFDLIEQTLNDFHALTLRNIVDSSDEENDEPGVSNARQIRF